MSPAGFEPEIPAFERSQTCALDARSVGKDSQFLQGSISKYDQWRGHESGKIDPQHINARKLSVLALKGKCKHL